MLTHGYSSNLNPRRVVVLGAKGFIGGEIVQQLLLRKISTIGLGRDEIDLLDDDAGSVLSEILTPDDVLIFASALAPCKDLLMLQANLKMAGAVCMALKKVSPAQVIYVSSDAVYKDSRMPIKENSCAEPESFHGIMHLAREITLKQSYSGPLAIVRPTLVYGLNDPHNSYGPNRFRRLACDGKSIMLFGNGEEMRDHVDVEDVAELICRIVLLRSTGTINAISGNLVSFDELARFVVEEFQSQVQVIYSPRIGEMPHGGFRAFNNHALLEAFPGFKFKSWREGLRLVHQKQIKKSESDSL